MQPNWWARGWKVRPRATCGEEARCGPWVGNVGHAMRYIDQVLQPGERILQVTTVSRVGYIGAIAVLIAAFVVWLLAAFANSPGLTLAGEVAALVLIALGLYLTTLTWWRRFTTEVAVTDRRVIYAIGFANRHTVEMNMDKIESVDVEQDLLGRLFNYGDIAIHGTGDTHEVLHKIDHPLDFRSHVTAA
jgi:uncharacterized membrane protein YdbT with pleckstrin-like domain